MKRYQAEKVSENSWRVIDYILVMHGESELPKLICIANEDESKMIEEALNFCHDHYDEIRQHLIF